jgi:hypothetical protein
MLSAENKCKKPPAPPYSDKLAALNKIILLWKIIKSNMTTGRNVAPIIESIKRRIPQPMQHLLVKTQAVNTHIKKAVDRYCQAVPNAMEMRQEQIRQWAEAAAQQEKKTMAQHFTAMANAEHTRNTFKLLQNVIKPQDRSGITKLKVPTTDADGIQMRNDNNEEQWHILTDPQKIEHTIIDRNIKHFGQATNTPFNSTQFTDLFSDATKNLLQGKLPDISKFPTKVQLILKKLSKNPQPTIDSSITRDDLKGPVQKLERIDKHITIRMPSGTLACTPCSRRNKTKSGQQRRLDRRPNHVDPRKRSQHSNNKRHPP